MRRPRNVLSVLLVEGPTERIFYECVKKRYLRDCACTIDCVEGLFNINEKILHALTIRHMERPVRAYCCLDRESRYAKTPGLDLGFIREQLAASGANNVLSVDPIIATQMIESWFFHDIQGIFRYLRVPRSQRNARPYAHVERLRVADLKQLFRRHGKEYCEGERSRRFIEALSIELIHSRCPELRKGITQIRRATTR